MFGVFAEENRDKLLYLIKEQIVITFNSKFKFVFPLLKYSIRSAPSLTAIKIML